MPNDTLHNEPASDATSRAGPRRKLSEAEFLDREADDARGAMSRTLDEMGQSLKDAGDVEAWARTYPWATVGTAATVGFLVAAVLVPKKRRAEDREPELLERILADEQISQRLRELAAEEEHHGSRDGVLQSLLRILIKTFGPAVQTAVATAMAAKATQGAAADGETRAEPDAPSAEPQPE